MGDARDFREVEDVAEQAEETAAKKPAPRWRRIAMRAIPILFYALLAVFLVDYLRSIDFSKLRDARFEPWYFIIATVLGLLFRYWGAFIWTVLLRSLGARQVRMNATLVYVYAKSWMGRYIPGTAPWILGKIFFASKQGISRNKLAVSSLLEGALQVIVQLLFALVLLLFDHRLAIFTPQLKWLLAAAAFVCVVLLVPPVFNAVVSLAYRVLRRRRLDREHLADARTVGTGFGLYAIGSFASGLSLFFISKTVYPELPYHQLSFVMGVSTLAAAVSMIAVFAPSGLGVREGIQLALLSVIMPTEIALTITVIMRLWSVACDFAFFGFAWVHRAVAGRTTRVEEAVTSEIDLALPADASAPHREERGR
ncbi:lysylphosphatidylglycerol synthase domain-containing protein [Gryllotalpicola ginsengisoli]|uniref:lysylphosphatidylglycerol synthase domain-containing protein n=1 Tax=Gryllotalpicola ginsengisoli TaxID=444608 RepID=UPI0003B5AD17|nr:lysylphosphatidylglycerol synthase domain-containing protein [Gryllotalpicola ginsengisoli]